MIKSTTLWLHQQKHTHTLSEDRIWEEFFTISSMICKQKYCRTGDSMANICKWQCRGKVDCLRKLWWMLELGWEILMCTYLYPHSLSNHETSFTKLSDKASPAFASKMLDLSNSPNQITKHQKWSSPMQLTEPSQIQLSMQVLCISTDAQITVGWRGSISIRCIDQSLTWQNIGYPSKDKRFRHDDVNEAITDSAFNTGGGIWDASGEQSMTQMHRSPLNSYSVNSVEKSGSEWLIPGVSDEVRGDMVVLGVPENALQLSFGLLSDGFTNLFVGNSPVEPHIQVDEGNIRGGNSVGHASNFPIQSWQQFSNGLHHRTVR